MKSLHCAAAYIQFSLPFKTSEADKSPIQNETKMRVLILWYAYVWGVWGDCPEVLSALC